MAIRVKKARSYSRSLKGVRGKAVYANTHNSTEEKPAGLVSLSFAQRLTPEVMGDRRTVSGINTSFCRIFRHKRLLVTNIWLSPDAAIMLWGALDDLIEDKAIQREDR